MHKIFVQRKKAHLKFSARRANSTALPEHLQAVDLGGISCVTSNLGARADGDYGFELTTLVLTTLVAPVTVNGKTFTKGDRYTEDVVELYLVNVAPANAAGLRVPAQWHNCIDPAGGFSYAGKWSCPIIINRPPDNAMIINYLHGVYQYGVDANNQPLTTTFDHYLIQMILPNQTLCYYAVPNTSAGEAHILSIQDAINNAQPGVPLTVGAESPMLFYDDLQMWIFDEIKLAF